jgi:hypothetical protein
VNNETKKIYIFFSNKEGMHINDLFKYGAQKKIGNGFTGDAYCIPIYSIHTNKMLLLSEIELYFQILDEFLQTYNEYTFEVVNELNFDIEKFVPFFKKYCNYNHVILPKNIKSAIKGNKKDDFNSQFQKITIRKLKPYLKSDSVYRALKHAVIYSCDVGNEKNDKKCLFLLQYIKHLRGE